MQRQDRSQYLSIAERRARPGSGTAPSVLRERSARYGTHDLAFLKGRIPFVIVGGLATRLYMPERMTLDADILVAPEDEHRTEEVLLDHGCERQGPLSIGGSTWLMPDRTVLALVVLDEPWTRDAVHQPVKGPNDLPCIALPYLVLMKLAAGRLQDLADIGRMMGAADEDALHLVREAVRRYRPADVEDLESIIRLGRLEFGASI